MSCIASIWVIIIGLIVIASGLASGPASSGTDNKLVFINNPTSQQIYGLDQATEIVKNPKFDSTRPSVLYIHGYIESLASSTTQLIVNAYIKEGSYNIFVLDWSILAGGSYPDAVSNSNRLGPKIAEILIGLFTHGLKSESIHLVGHSLGAHLAGQIGRQIVLKSNQAIKLRRISALDPAFPLYYPPVPATGYQHINRNDAMFVDIIHTDAGGYGAPKATGTVDFWVNGGRRFQPGCPRGVFAFLSENDLCSHHRSVLLWAESVSTPSSTITATLIRNPSVTSRMGINCPINATGGSYKIQTN